MRQKLKNLFNKLVGQKTIMDEEGNKYVGKVNK